jgi:ornithine--oxo-acid transaminase
MTPNKFDKPLRMVGMACGLGAPDQRCKDGPGVLRQAGLVSGLRARGFDAAWSATIHPDPAQVNTVAAIAEACQRLAQQVERILGQDGFPIVLGGDHSCAIGTWGGVARALRPRGALGLLWMDAHMDAHTPKTTESGAFNGMPLACLLGHGDPALTTIGDVPPLNPAHVCLVGVRSFESGEAALLQDLGVRIYTMQDIARQGLNAVMMEALAIVQQGTAGFGLTIDLDAMDPQEAPGVGTPEPGGLGVTDVVSALRPLVAHQALMGLEIVEYNPARDHKGGTAQAVSRLIDAVLPASIARHAGAGMAQLEQRFGAHNYEPLPVVLVRGKGVYLWDDAGRRYIDMMSAYSAVSHGHCHTRLTRVLTQQARTLAVTSRSYYNNRLPRFLKRLCEVTGQEAALPVNTGAEAVETALKVARKWGYRVKGIAPERAQIIACTGNFHGRSIAILGMSSEAQYRDGFGPFPPGFVRIPYGNASALERAITPETTAFLVEPVQGEGGIIVPPSGYLAECARICRRHNVLLICDEVQTGLGRTGKLLACEHEGVTPDGLILGKALGGGLLPVAAFLARRRVMDVLTPGDHGSTFGGNPLAAAVGLEALNVLIEEDLAARAAELGAYLLGELQTISSPMIREVRGKGLLLGIEFDPEQMSAHAFCERLLAHGVLSKDTHQTVVRLAPPLVISKTQIDAALKKIRASFSTKP